MDPIVTAGIITGGASLVGGISGQSATARSVKRDIKFQREMAQNKYQYLMNDLQAAGLNPILAAQSATAGPAGARAPTLPYMNPLGEAVQTGVQTYSTVQDVNTQKQSVEESKERVKQITQGIKNLVSEEYRNYIQASSMDQQARASMLTAMASYKRASAEIERVAGQLVLMEHQASGIDAQAQLDLSRSDFIGTQKEEINKRVEHLGKQIEIAEQNLKMLRPIGKMAETDYYKYTTYIKRLTETIPILGIILGGAIGRGLKGMGTSSNIPGPYGPSLIK